MAQASNHEETEEGFEKRMSQILNAAYTTLGVAVGSKLGLFDLMNSFDEHKTSHEIADAGGFKERYVREWLGLMVVSRIVDVDRGTKTYFLPRHRRATLRQAPPGGYQGLLSWTIPMTGAVLSTLMECFKKDGPRGIDHTQYEDLHKWRKHMLAKKFSWDKIQSRLDQVPGMVQLLESGVQVCDMGCSSGETVFALAHRFPRSTFCGIDIADEAIELANRDAERRGLKNVSFLVQDMCNMPTDWTDKWDVVIAWHVVHDVPETTKALSELYRTVKPNGVASMTDVNLHTNHADNVGCPHACFYYGISLFHCMTISLYHEHGEGVGATWGVEKAADMVRTAGFVDVKTIVNPNSDTVHYVLTKKCD